MHASQTVWLDVYLATLKAQRNVTSQRQVEAASDRAAEAADKATTAFQKQFPTVADTSNA